MVQRPTIRHFLAMVMDNKILEGQGRGSFKDLPRPILLKSLLFYIQWIWPVPDCAMSLSFQNINVHYQTFQMIYCELLYLYQLLRKLKKSKKKRASKIARSVIYVQHCNFQNQRQVRQLNMKHKPWVSTVFFVSSNTTTDKSTICLCILLRTKSQTLILFNFT